MLRIFRFQTGVFRWDEPLGKGLREQLEVVFKERAEVTSYLVYVQYRVSIAGAHLALNGYTFTFSIVPGE